jgi:hypothetical protein
MFMQKLEQERIRTVKMCHSLNMDIKQISMITGLTEEQVFEIQNS